MSKWFLLAALLALAAANPSEFFLHNSYGENMVLPKAPAEANLHGFTAPNSMIVAVLDQTVRWTMANSSGYWSLNLPRTPAGGPHSLTLNSTAGDLVSFKNILFGDIYFCSGQSNMLFFLIWDANATLALQDVNNYPDIRVSEAYRSTENRLPTGDLLYAPGWHVATNNSMLTFSAVCWFFGKNLYDVRKTPIGLISVNWGGTGIQTWTPDWAILKCHLPQYKRTDPDPNTPSVLWNALVEPYQSWKIAGVLWYQGEYNTYNASYYQCAFPVMIDAWRTVWKNPFLPFYFVQICGYIYDNNALGVFRIAQEIALKLRNVAMTCSYDLENPTGDIHSPYKDEVGRRLSLAARAMQYKEQITYAGPTVTAAQKVVSNGRTSVILYFGNQTAALVLKPTPVCPSAIDPGYCGHIAELQSSDGTWVPATWALDGRTFVLSVDGSVDVVAARCAWASVPLVVLYNDAGLPLVPFSIPVR